MAGVASAGIGVGTAILGGSILSGLFGSSAAKKQARAQRAATAEERRQFDLQRADTAPYREAGLNALGQMSQMTQPGYEFSAQDPSYAFRFGEGERATQNYLSGANLRLGGSALKAMTDYGQGSASQEYGNQFNRLGTMAGYGQAANVMPQNNIAQGIANQGQAEAGKYSAYNNAIQGGIQNYLAYDQESKWRDAYGGAGGSGGGSNIPWNIRRP